VGRDAASAPATRSTGDSCGGSPLQRRFAGGSKPSVSAPRMAADVTRERADEVTRPYERSVRTTWRRTPAGAAGEPLPHVAISMSSSVLSGSFGADDSEDEYAAVLDSGGAADPGAEASRPEWKARAAAWLKHGASAALRRCHVSHARR
jgi:hypothetical protein